jgi:hypothetical protein
MSRVEPTKGCDRLACNDGRCLVLTDDMGQFPSGSPDTHQIHVRLD